MKTSLNSREHANWHFYLASRMSMHGCQPPHSLPRSLNWGLVRISAQF